MPDLINIKLLFNSLSDGQSLTLRCVYSVSVLLFIGCCLTSLGSPKEEKIKKMNAFFLASVTSMFISFVILFSMFRQHLPNFWPYFVLWLVCLVVFGLIHNYFLENLKKKIKKESAVNSFSQNVRVAKSFEKEKEDYEEENLGIGS